ncbi:class I adenylate-forming enzyme family protein [Pseudomaricurvus alkylphenolicus]|uniref:class I adenylate-forming enzyme family protein n=1 Tax=Pseudomaricurvus alkylphenolicus TaxID=1306991 RepID=UPI001F107C31|nr:class I adenylate-forming enzyme family protein [Pseudomaricurvus alkylphenolicus]
MRVPELALISDYPRHYAAATPNADALVEQKRSYNWLQFERAVDRCARALYTCGVRRGERVALLSVPQAEYLILFMATARLGAIWQGLNPRQTRDELSYLLQDSRPKVLLGMEQFEGRDFRKDLRYLFQQCSSIASLHTIGEPDFSDFLALGAEVDETDFSRECASVRAEDPCLVVYTSGSTGRPKGALLSHASVVTSARTQCRHWWAEPLRILNNLPINHVGGAVQLSCQAIVAGGASVLMPRFDAEDVVKVVNELNVTFMHQIPMMYQKILECPQYREMGMACVQSLVWSGSPCPQDMIRKLREITPQLYTSYGSTELGGEALYMPDDVCDESLASFVGIPPAGYQVRLDPDSNEIQVRSKTVMSGYLNQPEATREAFTEDGWLKTGDCAEVDPDSGYWRIAGRIKEMYKSGGYNIYPREIELTLEQHPAVAMSAVFGVPDPVYTEKGVAYILLEAGARLEEADIKQFCKQHLANYKVPKQFFIRRELPMLPIGKIDKAQLKTMRSSK